VPWQLPHRVLPVPPHRLQGLAANWRAKGGPRDVTIRLSGCAGCESKALTCQLPTQAAPPASAAVPIISRCIQASPACMIANGCKCAVVDLFSNCVWFADQSWHDTKAGAGSG